MLVCAIIVSMWLGSTGAHAPQASASQDVSFDAFMKIDAPKRPEVFAGLTPENRAKLTRERASRWLRAHRSELSPRQIRAVEQAILFVTPEIYTNPDAPGVRERGDKVTRDLTCSLGARAALEAFSWAPPAGGPPAKGSTIDDWLTWFSDCVVR